MDKIRIVCLGGLDEFYKACTVIEINDDIFVVECGLKYPDVTKPGIDYIIARSDYLVENKHRVKAYFLTHGFDSVVGGLPYIYKNVPVTCYFLKLSYLIIMVMLLMNGKLAKSHSNI